MTTSLYWLPAHPDFRGALLALKETTDATRWQALRQLAHHDLDFVQTANLDRQLQSGTRSKEAPPAGLRFLKLAILASSTIDHLLPSIRVSAFRRDLLLNIYVSPFNQYRQEVINPNSGLYTFGPDVILLALDASEAGLAVSLHAPEQDVENQIQQRVDEWTQYWRMAKERLSASVIHQTIVVPPLQLFGQMDLKIPAAPSHILKRLNDILVSKAAQEGVLLLDLDHLASYVGKKEWCNDPLWFHAKQAISPAHGPLYGERLARLLAGLRGLVYKGVVVDLDNTLWGGVVGDDGLEGLELGQGTGGGEAFVAFQRYLRSLKERGILLSVCSKNEESIALSVFEKHPEMVLRRDDFAAFCVNWENKADNLERVAQQLNIGLDSLVFVDDNPIERRLVRQVLPRVAVPELPDDPAGYPLTLSDAGYFETVSFTSEDAQRAEQYQANAKRLQLHRQSHDVTSFLKELQMIMEVRPFDEVGRARIAQLINKSNQFNLTTRRYTEAQVDELRSKENILTFQIRLRDACGDNGIISVVIAKALPGENSRELLIDTWLMSCRVLGRNVEEEVLNVLVDQAKKRGYASLRGEYIPTEKNAVASEHYRRLGFLPLGAASGMSNGSTFWQLDIPSFSRRQTFIDSHYID